jgi:hypothetical protein
LKISYPKQYFIDRLKKLDKRALELDADDIDNIINDGFSELATISEFFSDEEVVSMKPYYESGEFQITIDIEEDVVAIYDYYLTVEQQSDISYKHGIMRLQYSDFRMLDNSDVNSMWLDNRYNGRVHIDLSKVRKNLTVDNAVIKYFYTPTANADFYYMDQQTRLATESAMASAMYDYLHDVERASQKRAQFTRQALAIVPPYPEDLVDNGFSMFPYGV